MAGLVIITVSIYCSRCFIFYAICSAIIVVVGGGGGGREGAGGGSDGGGGGGGEVAVEWGGERNKTPVLRAPVSDLQS